jgi:hypothetical protein
MGAYRERLLVPVAYWLLAVPTVAVLGAEGWFLAGGFIPPLIIGVLAVIVAAFLVNWSIATIEVTDGVLRAGGATLALADTAEVVALDERQSAALRGPQADPSAHLLLRPYLKRAVYVEVASPAAGAAPYWLVATRHPEQLASALAQARGPRADGEQPGGQQPPTRESVG